MKRVLGAALLAILLTGCMTQTPFQPADIDGKHGYTVTQIEVNRFRISFNGNSLTPRQVVDNDLLYLAAQLTLKNGFDWFEVSRNADDKTTSYPTYLDAPGPWGGWGGAWGGWGGGWGGAWGGGYSADFSSPRNSWDQVAEIITRRGSKPPSALHAYDARDVVAHLQPMINRAEARPGPF